MDLEVRYSWSGTKRGPITSAVCGRSHRQLQFAANVCQPQFPRRFELPTCFMGRYQGNCSQRWQPCTVRSAQNPDLIEKLVGAIFGKKALEDPEPGGMKRMSEEALAEQYPATTTEFADPLEGDSPEVATFRPLLAKTRLQFTPLRLAYDAKRDGWSAGAFHDKLNTYGAAVLLASTEGAIFGGYNPRGWIGLGDERNAISAFLFTWPDGDTSKPAIKLPKVGGGALAVIDKGEEGPRFGAEGLTIPLETGKERLARCRLGTYYARRPDGSRSLFADDENIKGTQLVDLKVWVAEGGPEQWELDGIVWKSSQS
eukprot:jgi/Botrbrau1/14795/Bobra.105_1s0008.2